MDSYLNLVNSSLNLLIFSLFVFQVLKVDLLLFFILDSLRGTVEFLGVTGISEMLA